MGKRWPSLMLLVLMLSSCVKVTTYTDYEPDHSRSYQTTLHYFIGTSLKSYFLNNISDARTAVEAGALGDNGSYFYCMPQSSSEAVLYELVLIEGE